MSRGSPCIQLLRFAQEGDTLSHTQPSTSHSSHDCWTNVRTLLILFSRRNTWDETMLTYGLLNFQRGGGGGGVGVRGSRVHPCMYFQLDCECPNGLCGLLLPAVIILCFPVIYILGALPQLSTFVIWFSEQIEMFFFGGTGNACTHTTVHQHLCCISGVQMY